MRILHVVHSLEIGGVQRFVVDLLPILSKEHDVSLLVFKNVQNQYETVLKSAGIEILSLNSKHYYDIRNIAPFLKVSKEYDIIHLHSTPPLYTAAIASCFNKARMVYTMHTTDTRTRSKAYMRPFEKWVYRKCSKIISISEGAQNSLQSWLLDNGSRYVVILNGVNLGRFKNCIHKINKEIITVVMVSRFDYSKDQNTLIRAINSLPSNVVLKLIGDGIRITESRKLVESLKLNERVSFLGARNDVPEILENADIAVQSSNWEGFGLTVVEAMASGIPVVASDIIGLKEVVEGAGLLFEAGNDYDLADKIMSLTINEDLYNSISNKCLERSKKFSIEHTAREYLDIYDAII